MVTKDLEFPENLDLDWMALHKHAGLFCYVFLFSGGVHRSMLHKKTPQRKEFAKRFGALSLQHSTMRDAATC